MSILARRSLLVGFIALLLGGLFWHFTLRPTAAPINPENVPGAIRETAQKANTKVLAAPAANATPVRTSTTNLTRTGTLDYAGVTLPNHTVTITSETQGKVMQVMARTGQVVRRGQAFAVADTYLKRLSITAAEAQLAQVRGQLEQARRQTERLRALAAERNASAVELETAQSQLTQLEAQQTAAQVQLDQAQRQLADATVRIPATGIMTERTVEPGAVLQPGSELGKIVDISTLKVRINVPEQEVFKLRLGQTARLQPDALPGLTLTARITQIGVVADDVRNFPVELTLANPHGRLKAGQSVRVVFN